MLNNPIISVIIPTYNREKTINRAIESVLSQTFKEYEIIVIDDGSIDNTKYIISQYIKNIKYHYQNNAGPSKARNIGIDLAIGKWIAFLDSDDLWFPDKLKIQFEEAIKANCDACFHDVVFYDMDEYMNNFERYIDYGFINKYINLNQNSKFTSSVLLNDAYKRLMKSQELFLTPTLLIKRNVIKNMGGYLESLRSSEDYELYYRLAVKNKILYLYKKLTICNIDPKRIYDKESMYEDRIEAIKISLRERILENDINLSSLAKQGLLYQLRCLAGHYRKSGIKMKALMNYIRYIKCLLTPIKKYGKIL